MNDANELVDEEMNEKEEEEMNEKSKLIRRTIPVHRCLKCNFINDLTYLSYQILTQIQELNDYFKIKAARKKEKKLIKDTIINAMKELYKINNNESNMNNNRYKELYNKRIELPIKRKNKIFTDVDF